MTVSSPSPLDAVDDLRSAARWTLAAAGAVGAALISGGPLIAAGQVHGTGHALLAGGGLVAALAGVSAAIWSTSLVLAPRLTTRATLAKKKDELADLLEQVEQEPAEFFGAAATSVDGLFARQDANRAIAVNVARAAAAATTPARREALAAHLRRVEANGARIGSYVQYLLALAHVWQLQNDLRRSRRWTLLGGILVVAGAVLFFIATSNPGPAYVPVVTTSPSAPASPSASARP
ncbi:MAG TPA: hypothetical protein VH478_17865 [Trebonia sp.]|nr:hypothetical protein [Trebonia sp.]